jgi:hypothetical protein
MYMMLEQLKPTCWFSPGVLQIEPSPKKPNKSKSLRKSDLKAALSML